MNWNGKYVSVEQIIAKVYRDLGMSDQINFADAVEWAGEAMELIGVPMHYTDEVERIKIEDNKAKLPCNLHFITTCRGYPTATFDETCDEIDTSHYVAMRYSTDAYHHWYCDGASFRDHNCNSEITYKVNDNYIFTNMETGYVLMAYKGIPVDENGFPRIPDDEKVKHGVAYHIMWKIAFIKFMQGKMSGQAYQIIERDRDWYIGAAQTRGVMPSIDMMESIKNNWIRLIPKINQHLDSFKSAGGREQRYTHNSAGGTSSESSRKDDGSDDTYFYIDN